MCDRIRKMFVFDTCFPCFPVEIGAKILGYIGAILNSLNVVISVVILVVLAFVSTPSPDSNPRNAAYCLLNITETSVIYYIVNFPNPAATKFSSTDVTLLAFFGVVISSIMVFSSVVLLIGLHKKRLPYIKFGLVVGVIRVTLFLAAALLEFPSNVAGFTLVYLSLSIYFLLVIRSAYYNISTTVLICDLYSVLTANTPDQTMIVAVHE